jgi:flavin-dependent dehydrogenase
VSSADIIVAGGGPAGLVAAIAAAEAGASVVVLEPRAMPIDKACGEGVMPGGVRTLAMLGVDRLRGRALPGVRYRDARDETLIADGDFRTAPALAVRRTILHEALVARLRSLRVRVERRRLDAFANGADGVEVDGLRARWLIGADGLRSRVRRLLGVELPPRRRARIGVRRHFYVEPWCERVEVHFAPGVEAYVTPIADDVVGVAFLFEKDRVDASWDGLLARFPILARHLANAEPASALRGAGPFEKRVSRRGSGSVILVGDAAGYLDPLTGEGVALGIESAALAIECIMQGTPGAYERRYRALTRRPTTLTSLLLAVASCDALHRPLLVAARALPRVFDEALEMIATPAQMTLVGISSRHHAEHQRRRRYGPGIHRDCARG